VEANEELGFPADLRDYGIGAQILRDLRVQRLRLMTNNLRKYVGLKGYGLTVEERIPIEIEPNCENLGYLKTKRDKLGHLLSCLDEGGDPPEIPEIEPAQTSVEGKEAHHG